MSADQQFVQMSDSEAIYEQECEKLEKRGKRLRRAALTTGVLTVISIICTIYTTIAVRWVLIEWQQPEKTAYEITENMLMFKAGIFLELVVCVVDVIIGITLGLIIVGAGVNPATAVTICTFKIVQQAVSAANIIFLVGASILLDTNSALYDIVQKYFYSDNMPPIGTQISYLLLVINQYGYYTQQIFGGMYMIMLGACICMWGVFPRYLGMSMWLAGAGYIVNSSLFLFFPGYDGLVTWLLLLPALVTHFWLAGWLLVNTPHPSKNRNLFPSFISGRPTGDAVMQDGGKRVEP
mmetsp:Transcript_4593/g.11811  ORF Transcript_4593/g.11811 Transcript_4593/m.11811 type:complete len:294 (-) Transcript_4593:315-1196(-)|eukprot:CAMPEP_0197183190 /NCGR_PEP_ID=MMETSP1423-20130617/7635_1 /TAXON_ID=476441 /ORGANISM="Pseudo-nitzschia heimii, Strain UNC1101" /LENGTH=293 /DNA_ID=CAMNT_0042633751 /DNA_START=103 /DNA_END=984 /DNA_ORIENTATION=+